MNFEEKLFTKIRKLFNVSNDFSIVYDNGFSDDIPNQIIIGNYYNDFLEIYCYYDNVCHNDKGPAIVYLNYDLDILKLSYLKYDVFHNNTGPAIICFKNNIIEIEEYYINGKRHNPIGPAVINRGVNRKKFLFYINDVMLSLDEFISFYEKRINNNFFKGKK
jgi:hypothetical protein